jgi:hypothetical protein
LVFGKVQPELERRQDLVGRIEYVDREVRKLVTRTIETNTIVKLIKGDLELILFRLGNIEKKLS